jgi:AAA+ superfamily predicted ATPase
MLCPSCGRDNPSNARFCGHCGIAQVLSNNEPFLAATPNVGLGQDIASRFRDSTNRLIGPLAEELRRVNRSGSSQERNAKNFIRSDLLNTFLRFANVDGTVSPEGAQFFLEVFGVLDPVSYKKWSADTAIGFLTGLIKSDRFIKNVPKPWAVTLLESYDGLHGTRYAGEAIAIFIDLASATISANGAATPKEHTELEQFKDALRATSGQSNVSASKKEPISPAESPNALVLGTERVERTNFRPLVQEFLSLSQMVAPKVNEMLKSATVLGPDGQPSDAKDFSENLLTDLFFVGAMFSKTTGTVSKGTADFVLSFMNELRATRISPPFPSELIESTKKTIEGQWKHLPVRPAEPITVTTLAMYDENFGTRYCEKARDLFGRLVSALAEQDATSTESTRGLVERYNSILSTNLQKHTQASTQAAQDSRQQVTPETFDSLLHELQGLIGLAKVKKDVAELANYIKVQQMRKLRGFKTPELSLHMVFYGNPGTGKTTVARLLARIYKSLGVLTQGQLVETDRSGLIAGYVGQTALKVKEVVERAFGGVLFIDEAYALKPKNDLGDFGDEAIETVLKLMEDNRGNLIVIVAGYPYEMRHFLDSNPGLESRFNKYLTFDDYSPDELLRIFQRLCTESQYRLDDGAASKLETLFESAFQRRDAHFGNARLARNAFEQAITNMATRIVSLANVEDSALEIIQATDIPDKIVTAAKANSEEV